MELLPLAPERPADAGEDEAPDRRAEQRQFGVPTVWLVKYSGRNRDERANDRCDPAKEDRPVLPALEPALGLDEIRLLQVEPAAVALEERTAPMHPDPPAPDRSDRVPDRAGEGDCEVRGSSSHPRMTPLGPANAPEATAPP